MKTPILKLFLFTLLFSQLAFGQVLSNKLKIGDGTNTDKLIEANKGSGSTNPKLKYNASGSKWQFSNDGSTFNDIASGVSSPVQSYGLINVGLSTSVSANAMTIALKQSDGSTDATGGSPATIALRSSTVTSGAFNQRNVTGALSITIPSGTTIGTVNGVTSTVYIYALDNAGTVELAVSLTQFSPDSVQSSSAISGGSSATTLYSTTARSNVPIRYLGRAVVNEATAGTWASNASELSVGLKSFQNPDASYRARVDSTCSSDPCTISSQTFMNTGTGWLTAINRTGSANYLANFAAGAFSAPPVCICQVYDGLGSQAEGCSASQPTTSSWAFSPMLAASGVAAERPFAIFCVGPK